MSFRVVLIIGVAVLLLAVSFLFSNQRTAQPDGSEGETAAITDDSSGENGDSTQDAAGAVRVENDEEAPRATPDNNELALGSRPLDWDSITDVDATREALIQAYEQGDVHAAYQLHELAEICTLAFALDDLSSHLEEEVDPDSRAAISDVYERAATMESPCQDSSLADLRYSMEESDRWQRKAAEGGHAEAMYGKIFAGVRRYSTGNQDAQEERRAREQHYYEQLRDSCHADALHSTGVHLARGSAVVNTLDRQTDWGRDSNTSRYMDAFAHRYAAARLREASRPADQARDDNVLLTAEQELQAREWADNLLANCP